MTFPKKHSIIFLKDSLGFFFESVGRIRAIICDKFTMKKDVKKFLKGQVRYLEKKCQKFLWPFFKKATCQMGFILVESWRLGGIAAVLLP